MREALTSTTAFRARRDRRQTPSQSDEKSPPFPCHSRYCRLIIFFRSCRRANKCSRVLSSWSNCSSRGGGKGRATSVAAATGGNEDWELAQHSLKVWFGHFALPFGAQLCGIALFSDSRFLPHFKLCEIRDPVGFPKLAKFLRNSDRDHRHLCMGIRGFFRAS